MINDIDKSSLDMVDWGCANCGCVQWMPKDFNDRLRSSHKAFYCLNGHANVYNKKTDLEEIENKLANECAKNFQLEARINQLTKENDDLSEIRESLKIISDKANKSFLKRLFD